jgi:hypothetical protein
MRHPRGFFQAKLWRRPASVLVLVLGATLASQAQPRNTTTPDAPPQVSFAKLVAELSEAGGYFDTDNLISNEKSYLHVIPELERRGVNGGVYLGVGPDQNFSYIARIRPAAAIIVDIRRDNLLLHLLFKAIFANAPTRVEYLCLLTGRAPPERLNAEMSTWRAATITKLADYVESAPRLSAGRGGELPANLRQTIARFGVPLNTSDLAAIAKFHQAFVSKGLSLQFQTFGRAIQSYNPTYRELLSEKDRDGRQRSFLASEDDYQFVRSLEGRDLVIPVVGDFAGRKALAAVGEWMRKGDMKLSAFYVSNVEDYLFRGGVFDRYMENVKSLPRTPRSVVIRSFFGPAAQRIALPGYYSASSVQNLNDMITGYGAGKYSTYRDLVDAD